MQTMSASAAESDEARHQRYLDLCSRAQGTNVNERTLLATDYLNHVNEIVMLVEIIPDAPECLDDCKTWQPMTYQEHFAQSGIADRDLAIEAYDYSPPEFRLAFDKLVAEMNRLVALTIARMEEALAEGNDDITRMIATRASRNLQDLIGQASAVIHGETAALDQAEIDRLMEIG
ncbi:MAG TPA: hypothetical protein VND94_18710 [Terriglobia bacterium]|nr:hypothetical protein [Terriglobia bacterium]